MHFEDEHEFGGLLGNGRTYAYAMAHEQIVLQLRGVVRGDFGAAQGAKAGVDAIDRIPAFGKIADDLSRSRYLFPLSPV
jgi:hypothetical protein